MFEDVKIWLSCYELHLQKISLEKTGLFSYQRMIVSFLVLKLHEDLIVSKSATEYSEAKYLSYQDEANLLRDQLLMRDRERQAMERELTTRIQTLE